MSPANARHSDGGAQTLPQPPTFGVIVHGPLTGSVALATSPWSPTTTQKLAEAHERLWAKTPASAPNHTSASGSRVIVSVPLSVSPQTVAPRHQRLEMLRPICSTLQLAGQPNGSSDVTSRPPMSPSMQSEVEGQAADPSELTLGSVSTSRLGAPLHSPLTSTMALPPTTTHVAVVGHAIATALRPLPRSVERQALKPPSGSLELRIWWPAAIAHSLADGHETPPSGVGEPNGGSMSTAAGADQTSGTGA